MKIVIYRDKVTNKITNYHPTNDRCTEENLRIYNETEKNPTKAEFVELEEDSLAYHFYSMKTATIERETDDLRDLMSDLENIADRIDDRLYRFDNHLETEKERIREETAQDILESIFFNPNIKLSPELTATIEKLADEYLRADSKISLEELRAKRKYQIGKDTAKEILHDIYETLLLNYTDEEIGVQDECIDTACLYEDLKEIAKKYGVEVD